MTDLATASPPAPRIVRIAARPDDERRGPRRTVVLAWLAVTAVVIGLSVAIIVAVGMRPGYDAFGWLVWGHQVLHGSLNTDGAPSWKPVTFLFTLPYELAGDSTQMFLWMVTAIAAALAGCVFAARIAYRLVGPSPERRYAPYIAGAFAAGCLLTIDGYSHLVLIASSDPMIATLCLAAIDFHLSRRSRLAFSMLVLASLGRPEAWPFALLYAAWSWRAVPAMRPLAVGGLVLIPAFWFTIPALTSKSWFSSGDLALRTVNAVNMIHGSRLAGVVSRFTGLCSLPVEVAALVGVVLAAVRRDLVTLGLAAAACLWVAVEFAMALHGWSAASRYLIEPAAVMVVIAASAVGRVLAYRPRARHNQRLLDAATAVASVALVALLAASLVPTARQRARTARGDVEQAQAAGTQIRALQRVVAQDGGAARIRACGQPVTLVGLQSKVAWATHLNVGNVGFRPGRAIDSGQPIVFFQPHGNDWWVLPFNMRRTDAASCGHLKIDPS